MTILEESVSTLRRFSFKPFALPQWVSPVVALGLFCGAMLVMHNELGGHGFHSLSRALSAISPGAIAAASGFAFLSYVCLVGDEKLALVMLGKRIPIARMWRASFTAYALGNALGFSFATAPAARSRLYKVLLAPTEIVAVSAVTGVSVIASAAIAAGIGLLFSADEVATHLMGDAIVWRVAGIVLVAPACVWLWLSTGKRRNATFGGAEVNLPSPPRATLQILVGVADWAAAAAVLFQLMPDHGGWSFPAFTAVFVASGLLGAVSGSPGGVGVFEASILALAPASQHPPSAIAALVTYRIIYTLSPLAIAAFLLGHDIVPRLPKPVRRRLGGVAIELAPQMFSVLAFASGAILLLSSATPAIASRLQLLTATAPLFVVELSHFLASLTGVLLLVVSAALWRKLEGAYIATLSLLGLGAVFAVLKGFDIEEALILGVVALTLFPCRSAFTRKSRLLSEALSPTWVMAVLGAVTAAGWLGLFAYRHVDYSDDLWWTFLRDADASRFLRGGAGAAVAVVLISAWSLLAPPRSRWRGRPDRADVDRAEHAMDNAEDMRGDAHLALLGDKDLLFSPTGKSFIMFRARNHRWIAMSEPCGLISERRALMWRFVELADETGASPVFYSVTDALLPAVAELGMAVRKIGETAVVPIQSFTLEGKDRAGLRHSRNKAERDGTSFEILPPGSASLLAAELQAVSDYWLARHTGAEKSFSLGRFDIGFLDRTPLAVVRTHGRIDAFANVWATPDKQELTVDLMRHGEHAPRSVMDYLFVKLIEWGKAEGYREFDLGMAPLAGLDTHRLAPAFSRIGATLFEEGEAIYGFRGLRAYKEKFAPVWRPLYIAARPGAIMGLALLDAALLTSGGWRGILKGAPASPQSAPHNAPERRCPKEYNEDSGYARGMEYAPGQARRHEPEHG